MKNFYTKIHPTRWESKTASFSTFCKTVTTVLFFLIAQYVSAQTLPTHAESDGVDNNSAGTAVAINTAVSKIKGTIFPNADVDYYSFTAQAGDKVFAATMTSFSSSSNTDSVLALYGSDGVTVLEADDNDGTLSGNSSSIAGATIPAAGTYYLRVNSNSLTTQIRPYFLYLNVVSGSASSEVEPNDAPASANPLSGNLLVSGSLSSSTDVDVYSVSLTAGETVYLSLDLDPDRDATPWNGQVLIGAFGATSTSLVVNDASVAALNSEAFPITVLNSGLYNIYVSAPAGVTTVGNYQLAVSRFAKTAGYTNYSGGTNLGAAIPNGATLPNISSTITIPTSGRIKDIAVNINLTSSAMLDLDVVLTAPDGSSMVLFSDIGNATFTSMNARFSDNAAIPPLFAVLDGVVVQPELNSWLSGFKNSAMQGNWTLTIYDDTNNTSTGVLNNWSIDILTEPEIFAGGTQIYGSDFELTDGGFTHSGTLDTWELGTPTFAPITTANSGTICWKTNLDGVYTASSANTLLSPVIDLTTTTSGVTYAKWAMKAQMESASFDNVKITAEEVGGLNRVIELYNWYGATQTQGVGIPSTTFQLSDAWSTNYADVSVFNGSSFRLKFSLTTDTTVQLAGLAIDDVFVYSACTTPAPTASAQTVCAGATVADLAATGTDLQWYDLASGGTALDTAASVVAGTYYVSQTLNGCEGPRTAVAVTVTPLPIAVVGADQVVCNNAATTATQFTTSVSGTVCATAPENGDLILTAPAGTVFTSVLFASYGTPNGACNNYTLGGCHASNSLAIVSGLVIGQNSVIIPVTNTTFGDPCNGTVKRLYVQAAYSNTGTINWTNDNTSIGLAASGTGNIPSFTAVNNGTTPVVAIVSVTFTANNCTSLPVPYTITVNPTSATNETVTACDSYTWLENGAVYTTSGVYTNTTTNSFGCSNVATLNLTINNSSTTTETVTACDSYTWSENGTTYSTSGVYTNTTTNASGCPNVATLNLTINNSSTTTETVTTCDSYTWSENGMMYFTTGVYTNTTTNAAGCPNVATLNLTINNSSSSTETVTACDSYTWSENGMTYSTSGVYTNTTTNASGCPNVATLNLTINNSTTDNNVTTSAFNSYTWDAPLGSGLTYTTSGVYTHTTINASGCPNVATLNLTIIVNSFNIGTSCGATINNLAVTIVAAGVPGASTYTFRITNLATNASFVVNRPVNSFALSSYAGITLGTPYQIEVSVNGGANYGSPCIVYTPTPTSTIGAQCGTTLTSFGQFVYATYASSVTGYRFRVTNLSTNAVQVYDALSGHNRFTFNQLSAAIRAYSTTYSVEVALRNTDGTYLPYGASCEITTPAFPTSEIVLSQCDSVATSNTQTFNAVAVSGATEYRFQLVNSALGYSFSIDRPLSNFNLSMFSGLQSGTTYTVRVAVRIAGVWGPLTGKPCNITTPGVAAGGSREIADTFIAIAYPNPFAENFMFQVTTTAESTIQIKVYDMLGKQVENSNVEVNAIDSLQVGDGYPSGVYNVIVSQGANTQTLRVIKR